MDKKTFLKTFDLTSYLLMVIGAIFIVVFEFSTNYVFLKVSILIYAVSLLMFIVFEIVRIVFQKQSMAVGEKFTTKEIVFTSLKLVIALVALIWMSYIFIKML